MPRRAPSTFADYLVVAISPALIMLLVGSLMFFLIEVFYQGQYGMRLWFIMAMFVMAIVCVARISMEEGAGYAALFGAPLALVSLLALARFVQISGPLAPFSLLINAGLMALVWWAAHKLTWDCTLIDDTQDASGQGLLQELGVDPTGGAADGPAGTSAVDTSFSPRERGAGREGAGRDATSGAVPVAEQPWWQRWLEADRRPHAPGLWVVYFSLAALPLFGIGGWFIPASAADARQRAMLFLTIYVASGLTLLLATSFLGLRRYLRQRRLEMPVEMAAVWVGLGLAMIAAMLAVCYVLPRPDSLASLADVPISFTSPDRTANHVAAGPEGAKERPGEQSASAAPPQQGQTGEQPGANGQSDKSNEAGGNPSQQGESAGEGQGSDQSQSKGATNSDQAKDSGNDKSGNDKSGGDKSGGNQGEKSGGDKSGGDKSGNGEPKSDDNSKGGSQTEKSTSSDTAKANRSDASDESASPKTQSNQAQQQQANQPSPPRSSSVAIQWGNVLPWLLRVLLFVAIAIAAVWLAWRYRAEIAAAWQKLLQELRELWDRLFGHRRAAAAAGDAVATRAVVDRSFASFTDPFASGTAARMAWPDLVRYTFHALEAWGREHGYPRAAGQTPHEFAACLAQVHPGVGRFAPSLADAYGQIAYAPQRTSAAAADPLRQLWQQMRASPAAAAVA